ncbi:MAG: hypothetical protein M1837_006397 [Sclerophora amabilis]|nr:MAG: hypothetical protein M1837_006397 [Sclerophora amabilis]
MDNGDEEENLRISSLPAEIQLKIFLDIPPKDHPRALQLPAFRAIQERYPEAVLTARLEWYDAHQEELLGRRISLSSDEERRDLDEIILGVYRRRRPQSAAFLICFFRDLLRLVPEDLMGVLEEVRTIMIQGGKLKESAYCSLLLWSELIATNKTKRAMAIIKEDNEVFLTNRGRHISLLFWGFYQRRGRTGKFLETVKQLRTPPLNGAEESEYNASLLNVLVDFQPDPDWLLEGLKFPFTSLNCERATLFDELLKEYRDKHNQHPTDALAY